MGQFVQQTLCRNPCSAVCCFLPLLLEQNAKIWGGNDNSFLDSSAGKESTCNAGNPGLTPGWVVKVRWRRDRRPSPGFLGFPCGSYQRIHLQTGRPGFNPWVGRRGRLPTPVFWPGEFHGLYCLWVCNDPDMTKRLSLPNTFRLSESKSFAHIRAIHTMIMGIVEKRVVNSICLLMQHFI